MDKNEFLKKLTIIYPASFYKTVEKNGFQQRTPNQGLMNELKERLNGTPTEFEALYQAILNKNETPAFLPSVSWLVQQMGLIQYKPPKIIQFDKTKLSPPPQRFYEELAKLRQTVQKRRIEQMLQEGGQKC
jgi:hypothetical protein